MILQIIISNGILDLVTGIWYPPSRPSTKLGLWMQMSYLPYFLCISLCMEMPSQVLTVLQKLWGDLAALSLERKNLVPGKMHSFVQHTLKIGSHSQQHVFALVDWCVEDENKDKYGKPVEIWRKTFFSWRPITVSSSGQNFFQIRCCINIWRQNCHSFFKSHLFIGLFWFIIYYWHVCYIYRVILFTEIKIFEYLDNVTFILGYNLCSRWCGWLGILRKIIKQRQLFHQ